MKKKILFVTGSMGFGGLEKQIFYLLKELSATGRFELALFIRKNIINFPDIKSFCSVYTTESQNISSTFKALNQTVGTFDPDIIHTLEGLLTLLILPVTLLKKKTLINGQIRNAKSRSRLNIAYLIARFNMFFSKYVIANSKAGLKAYRIRENVKNKVVYNGFDIEDFDNKIPDDQINSEIKGNKIIIGKVANFTRPKDYKTLIKAGLKLLEKRSDLKFVFIGNGPNIVTAKKMIPERLSKSFRFFGNRSDAEAWIKIFDICVLLSGKDRCEGLSNSIMEYMAAAKPVIATNDGGNPELIKNGVNGFLIPHEDVNGLIEKIEFLILNEGECLKMGLRNREIIEECFSLKNMTCRYIKLYEKILK